MLKRLANHNPNHTNFNRKEFVKKSWLLDGLKPKTQLASTLTIHYATAQLC